MTEQAKPAPLWWPLVWIPAVIWMGMIFWGSSFPQDGLKGMDFFGLFEIPHSDKIAHMGEYGILGFLLARGIGRSVSGGLKMVVIFTCAAGMTYGITDEIHQIFVPTRTPSLVDFLFDSLGVTLGGIAWSVGTRWKWVPRWV